MVEGKHHVDLSHDADVNSKVHSLAAVIDVGARVFDVRKADGCLYVDAGQVEECYVVHGVAVALLVEQLQDVGTVPFVAALYIELVTVAVFVVVLQVGVVVAELHVDVATVDLIWAEVPQCGVLRVLADLL